MQPGGEFDRGRRTFHFRQHAIGKINRQRDAARPGQRLSLGGSGMEAQQLVDGRSGRALPAFAQPEPRHHRRVIWPPDAGHEHRFLRGGHGAGGGAEDVGHIVDRAVKHADGADAARVGIDHSDRHRSTDRQAHLLCRRGAKAVAAGGSRIDNPLADADKIFIRQLFEANLAEVAGIPALFMRQVGPFTGHGTDRAG